MSPGLRHYLLMEHVFGAAIINVLLNALIVWLSFRHLDVVPLWGAESIAGDMVGTTIVLPLLTCSIVTRIVAWHLRQGRISPADFGGDAGVLRKLPSGIFARGLALGAVTTVTVPPVLVALLLAFGVVSLDLRTFVIFKAAYAGILAAMVQPVVALWVIAVGTGLQRAQTVMPR